MALRSPIYLDTETLLSQAEYHDIEVPRQADIVEKTVRKRSGGGKVGLSGVGVGASAGTNVEYQSTCSLAPKEKATVSKLIDSLIKAEAIKVNPDGETVLGKDDLVEIEGLTRITAASLAGKIFFIFRRLMDTAEGGLESIFEPERQRPPNCRAVEEGVPAKRAVAHPDPAGADRFGAAAEGLCQRAP